LANDGGLVIVIRMRGKHVPLAFIITSTVAILGYSLNTSSTRSPLYVEQRRIPKAGCEQRRKVKEYQDKFLKQHNPK